MTDGKPVLRLSEFGVAFGEQIVLADVTLEANCPGAVVVMGPGGVGKSTLLRTLAGLNESQPALRTWGEATYEGRPLGEGARPRLVIQNARFLTSTVRQNLVAALPNRSELTQPQQTEAVVAKLEESGLAGLVPDLGRDVVELSLGLQRCLAIVRATLAQPSVLLVDEATAGLTDEDAARVLDQLAFSSRSRGVVFVTHNQQHARRLGGRTYLLAGGRIQAEEPTEQFFTAPQSDASERFVRTGGIAVPNPNSVQEVLADPSTAPAPLPAAALNYVSHIQGPRGFHWLKRGYVGGLPRPGIVAELKDDLEGLNRLGVDVLVTLEETPTVSPEILGEYGIESVFFPVDDMKAPTCEAAKVFCSDMIQKMHDDHIVAMHCRAGLGRTGTMLACILIAEGVNAIDALEQVREINPRWIQSDEQIAFLSEFEAYLQGPAMVAGPEGVTIPPPPSN